MTKCPQCKQVAFPTEDRGQFHSERCMDCGAEECFDCLLGECEGHSEMQDNQLQAFDAGVALYGEI